tara:strand:+ start:248 stop:634 length:387 start_codon:yes stop_codon:yes gene_type:complete
MNTIVQHQINKIKTIVQYAKENNNHATHLKGLQNVSKSISKNIDFPTTPLPCAGTSFQCNVAGSGTMPIHTVAMHPTNADYLATNMQEGGILGTSFENNTIQNCRQNSICTPFTNQSLQNTIGFENFQ